MVTDSSDGRNVCGPVSADLSVDDRRRRDWVSRGKGVYDAAPGVIVSRNDGPDGLLLCAAYEGGYGKSYKLRDGS